MTALGKHLLSLPDTDCATAPLSSSVQVSEYLISLLLKKATVIFQATSKCGGGGGYGGLGHQQPLLWMLTSSQEASASGRARTSGACLQSGTAHRADAPALEPTSAWSRLMGDEDVHQLLTRRGMPAECKPS